MSFTYTIPTSDDDSYYLHYAVSDGSTVLLDFYTNNERAGYFTYESGNNYRQAAGTLQFSMPVSRDAARRKLLEMARVTVEEYNMTTAKNRDERSDPDAKAPRGARAAVGAAQKEITARVAAQEKTAIHEANRNSEQKTK
jgi:hypothetical protein